MARLTDREKSLILRKQGKSYSQIKETLHVSKGSLSVWLKDYPLSKERIRELRDCNSQRIEKYRNTMKKKREDRLKKVYDVQKIFINTSLNKQNLFLNGLFLYWGEGSKTIMSRISVSNTDPSMINFFIYWFIEGLKVPKNKLKAYLHLYQDMNIDDELKFWSKKIRIPLSQFNRPYIKKTSSERINHKGSFGHGTCNIQINDTALSERILMSIKAISDRFK